LKIIGPAKTGPAGPLPTAMKNYLHKLVQMDNVVFFYFFTISR